MYFYNHVENNGQESILIVILDEDKINLIKFEKLFKTVKIIIEKHTIKKAGDLGSCFFILLFCCYVFLLL